MQWEPGSTWSPGALDAAVHLATDILPAVAAGAKTSSLAGRRRDSIGGQCGVAGRRR
ncbi:hypothetical protein [Nocardia sp. NPDC059239]|uniref:hypothetical protein n=1 Tax=unclassified Nocardia TaxID=2637762 RepID=UPI0036A95AE9